MAQKEYLALCHSSSSSCLLLRPSPERQPAGWWPGSLGDVRIGDDYFSGVKSFGQIGQVGSGQVVSCSVGQVGQVRQVRLSRTRSVKSVSDVGSMVSYLVPPGRSVECGGRVVRTAGLVGHVGRGGLCVSNFYCQVG